MKTIPIIICHHICEEQRDAYIDYSMEMKRRLMAANSDEERKAIIANAQGSERLLVKGYSVLSEPLPAE